MSSRGTYVGVIGSAGRKEDAKKMTKELFYQMLTKLEEILTKHFKLNLSEVHLVSGGAAWADHLAVMMYLEGKIPALTLHLPAPLKEDDSNPCFCESKKEDIAWRFKGSTRAVQQSKVQQSKRKKAPRVDKGNARQSNDAGRSANKYHREFSSKIGEETLEQLLAAKYLGATLKVHEGFKARNTAVAQTSQYLIAFTWNDGHSPKPNSGTADTWKKFGTRDLNRIHVPLSSLRRITTISAGTRAGCSSVHARLPDSTAAECSNVKLDVSQTFESDSRTPQSGIPDSGTSQSGISDSRISQSGISDSGTSQSGISVSDSGTSQPGISDSGTSQPEIPESGTSQSGISVSESGTSQSGISVSDSGTSQPEIPESGTSQSGISDSGTSPSLGTDSSESLLQQNNSGPAGTSDLQQKTLASYRKRPPNGLKPPDAKRQNTLSN